MVGDENITRQIHADVKKRRSFLAMLFATGDLQRYERPQAVTHNVVAPIKTDLQSIIVQITIYL